MTRTKKLKRVFDNPEEFLQSSEVQLEDRVKQWIKDNWDIVKESTHMIKEFKDIEFISSVQNPNMQSDYVFSYLEDENSDVYMENSLMFNKEFDSENKVYAAVLTPELGEDGLLAPTPVIEDTAELFLEEIAKEGKSQLYAIDEDHNQMGGRGKITGSMILPDTVEFDSSGGVVEIPKGSWIIEASVDDELMRKVKEGIVEGWSIQGKGLGIDTEEFTEAMETFKNMESKKEDMEIEELESEVEEMRETIQEVNESIENIDTLDEETVQEIADKQIEDMKEEIKESNEKVEEEVEEEVLEEIEEDTVINDISDFFDVDAETGEELFEMIADAVENMQESEEAEDLEESEEAEYEETGSETEQDTEEVEESVSIRERTKNI